MREITEFSLSGTGAGGGDWRSALRQAIRDPDELCDLLELGESVRPAARAAAREFPLVVPRGFVARMRRGDPRDPLLLQVLPVQAELSRSPGELADPVGDAEATIAPGLLRKYEGRALLLAAASCAIHCRYCFRRHFAYSEVPRGLAAWGPALEEIARDASLHEVILSGGDPLLLVDETLAALVARLEAVPHLRRVRVHTRLPVVLPERITPELIDILRATRLTSLVVIHANHPAELTGPSTESIARLVDAGIPVLNQTVLLQGVNDDVETLAELSARLVDLRALPYYLHQLDPVAGAAHFEVAEERGRKIIAQLERRLPGYAVPKYVKEIPGAASKVRL